MTTVSIVEQTSTVTIDEEATTFPVSVTNQVLTITASTEKGATGATGATGPGVPTGGTINQVLKKNSSTDYDTSWSTVSGSGTPGGSSGQVQYNNAGALGGVTVSGDGTLDTSTGALVVTKTAGVAFAASATTDTTNAANITSGNLSVSRLNSGTSASSSTYWRGDGTWATPAGGGGTPGGTNGQVQINSSGSFGGITVGGDATLNSTTGALTVTKTNGVSFAASAITDATNAANITSGHLAIGRFNGGSNANTTTYWRGDGTWVRPTFAPQNGEYIWGTGSTTHYQFLAVDLTYYDVTEGGAAVQITLPGPVSPETSATYSMICVARATIVSDATSGGYMVVRLYNSTAAAAIADSDRLVMINNVAITSTNAQQSTALAWQVTVTTSSVIRLQAKAGGTGTPAIQIGSDTNGRVTLSYQRIA